MLSIPYPTEACGGLTPISHTEYNIYSINIYYTRKASFNGYSMIIRKRRYCSWSEGNFGPSLNFFYTEDGVYNAKQTESRESSVKKPRLFKKHKLTV